MLEVDWPRNHLVHALKVFASETMPLRGEGSEPLRADPLDKQLHETLSEGILCQVLDEGMYLDDKAGMSAIVQEDNLNAAIDMGIGEMEVVSYVMCIHTYMLSGRCKRMSFIAPRFVCPSPCGHFHEFYFRNQVF